MALDLSRNLFNQRDVRELSTTLFKSATATIKTNFSATRTSSGFADVTGGSVTISGLDSTKVYSILAFAVCQLSNTSSTTNTIQLLINSILKQPNTTSTTVVINKRNVCVISVIKAQTGVTSHTAKLQHLRGTGTLTTAGSIMMMAIEE